ncbi:HlyD family efflux transporter periplasmic adaptor subunit [Gemmatimonas aurantiaca]|uniref:HlyD family secretion protein n=1 Tax=Gemmatimonas aurantiaca TaxID=173480 RepID=UPI00301BFB81
MDIPKRPPPKHRRFGAFAIASLGALAVLWRTRDARAPQFTLERSAVHIDTVRRGMVRREVAAQGTLVPESVVVVVATASARVERVLVRAGDSVHVGDPLVELANPDVTIRALEAEQRVRIAQTDLASTEASLLSGVLAQRAQLATAETQYRTASIDAVLYDSLVPRALASEGEKAGRAATLAEAFTRRDSERARLALFERTTTVQLESRQRQIAQLTKIADAESQRARALTVRAQRSGVVQDLALDPGQWVPAGQALGRIIDTRRLKSAVRIPETLALDVAVGQAVSVDTRNGLVRGVVSRKAPGAQGGTILVEIQLLGELPRGAVPDLGVSATITVDAWNDVLYVRRPVSLIRTGDVTVFAIDADGRQARAIRAQLADASDVYVRVMSGLPAGARIITSETASFATQSHVRIR